MRFAKKRIVGCPMPTHMAPVVALEPAGSDSDEPCLLSPTFHGSFPLTIFAPPLKVHPELDSAMPTGGRHVVREIEPRTEDLPPPPDRRYPRRTGRAIPHSRGPPPPVSRHFAATSATSVRLMLPILAYLPFSLTRNPFLAPQVGLSPCRLDRTCVEGSARCRSSALDQGHRWPPSPTWDRSSSGCSRSRVSAAGRAPASRARRTQRRVQRGLPRRRRCARRAGPRRARAPTRSLAAILVVA